MLFQSIYFNIFQIVCENRDFYASACAVARAYPSFTKKTNLMKNITVNVEFIIVSEHGEYLISIFSHIFAKIILRAGLLLTSQC